MGRAFAPLRSAGVDHGARVARIWNHRASSALVEDIVQEIFLKLCEHDRRILRQFEPRGEDSFMGLLRIVSASVANDYFRRTASAKRGGKVLISSLDDEAPAAIAGRASEAKSLQHQILLNQLDQKLRAAPADISERDRSIFWLYYRQGLTAEEIARVPGVELTPKGVESALRKVVSWIKSEIQSKTPNLRAEPAQDD